MLKDEVDNRWGKEKYLSSNGYAISLSELANVVHLKLLAVYK